MEIGLRGYTPAQVGWGRILFGLLAMLAWPTRSNPVDRSDLARLVLLGATWMAIPLNLFPIAEQWIDSSVAGMLNAGMPVFTVAIGVAVWRRRPTGNEVLGVAVGLIGVLLVALPTARGGGRHQAAGVALCILAVASYGAAAHLNVGLVAKYGSVTTMRYALSAALVLSTPSAAAGISRAHPTLGSTLSIVVLGALGTGLAYVMASKLIGRVGAVRASVITYLIPPLSVLWGALFLDERVHRLALVGTAVILAGAQIISRARSADSDDVVPTELELGEGLVVDGR